MVKEKNILWFNEVGHQDIDEVGGKGANLGELVKIGIPVPPGYIVTSGAYFNYLAKSGLKNKISRLLKNIDPEDSRNLNKIAKEIQDLIINTKMPDRLAREISAAYETLYERNNNGVYVAVRSSATAEDLPSASFAGQQRTFLNVSGEKEVVKAVQYCWASLFEARAIYYRAINNFEQMKVGIAVPVQAMIQSEKSGILFTIDPVTNDKSVIVIDAGYGLGEAIVSGSISPDRYIVDKAILKIMDKEIKKQTWQISMSKEKTGIKNRHISIPKAKQNMQKISDKEIIKLTEYGIKIEKHYNYPQDTEWAIAKGKIYFVQSRPVTTITKKIPITETDQGHQTTKKANIILKGAAASIGIAWGPVKIIHKPTQIDQVEKGDVLVTEMTTPDFVPAMKRATAIVTDTGGRTCHAAIVSRELGIPCVVGTGTASHVLKNGQMVTVDGANGLVYKGKIVLSKEEKAPAIGTRDQVRWRGEVPVTGTKVYVNLAAVDKAEKIASEPVDGIGLLRAEFMIAEMGKHPKQFMAEGKSQEFIQKLADGIAIFARAFNPRPVVYRATDFKTNEYKNLAGGEKFEKKEENPMIGYRGCMRYVKDPETFKLELEAIKIVREKMHLHNLWLMLPFVRTVDELVETKKIMESVGLVQSNDFKLWIMCEVPSNVILINEFIEAGIDGVSIGSNDLTQLILGVDRDNAALAEEFDERNSAVVCAIKNVIRACRAHNITCSICGQAPSVYPEFTEMLVRAGITSVSINPDMIVETRRLVASVEKRLLLKQVIK